MSERPKVRRNEDGTLDEVVADGCYFHLEQMSDSAWWLVVDSGGVAVSVNLFTKRGAKILATYDVDHSA